MREVSIALRGLQFEGSLGGDEIETIQFGELEELDGKDSYVVKYEEIDEDTREVTVNSISFSPLEVNYNKEGMVNANMVFLENKKTISTYVTPFGELIFGIDTKKIDIKKETELLRLGIEYALEINYEFLADCKIDLEIRPKNQGGEMI